MTEIVTFNFEDVKGNAYAQMLAIGLCIRSSWKHIFKDGIGSVHIWYSKADNFFMVESNSGSDATCDKHETTYVESDDDIEFFLNLEDMFDDDEDWEEEE